MKIQNHRLANQEVHFSEGAFKFDENGIADVQPDEFAQSVLELEGYFPVEEPKEDDKTIMAEGKAIEDMTGKELDQLAEQLGVENYPVKGNKEAKITAISAHIESSKE